MFKIGIGFWLLKGTLLFAASPPPSPLDLLTADTNASVGKLFFKRGNDIEAVEFGPAQGHFGLAMVFKGAVLGNNPPEVANKQVIQIVLGTNRTKLQQFFPQFGSVGLIVPQLTLSELKRVDFMRLDGKQALPKDYALMMFHSPNLPGNSADDEKLKSTYFAQGGNIALVPLGAPSTISVRDRGQSLRFTYQKVHLNFHALLVTPFNPQEAQVDGGVDVPFYTPYGKDSELFANRVAMQSQAPLTPERAPVGISEHKRELAGSSKKGPHLHNGPPPGDGE